MASNVPRIVQGQVRVELSAARVTQDSVKSGEDESPNTSQTKDSQGKKRKFGITIAPVPVQRHRSGSDTESPNSSFTIICDEDLPIFHDMRKRRITSSEESYSEDGDDDEVVCFTPPNYEKLARSMEYYGSQDDDDDDAKSVFVLGIFPPLSQNSSASSSQSGRCCLPSPLQGLHEENPADSQIDEETQSSNARV